MELVTWDCPRSQRDKRPLTVVPIGDIQWAGKRGPTALDVLRRTIDRALEEDAYFLGVGDYIDFMSPSNRQRLKGAALYDTAEDVIDDKALELTHEIYELALKPTKGRWLGMLEGHHFTQLKSGDTTDMRLCAMLDAKHLGTSAYVRLQFRSGVTDTGRCNVVLWCHHGTGGGTTAAGPLNKLERAAFGWEGADIFVMGHTCKMPATRIQRPFPRWHGKGAPDLVHRSILLVNSGGFARSYTVGSRQGQVPRGGYAEVGMMNPVPLGAPFIRIQPQREDLGDGPTRRRTWSPRITVEV
jgi:hypothetical protein